MRGLPARLSDRSLQPGFYTRAAVSEERECIAGDCHCRRLPASPCSRTDNHAVQRGSAPHALPGWVGGERLARPFARRRARCLARQLSLPKLSARIQPVGDRATRNGRERAFGSGGATRHCVARKCAERHGNPTGHTTRRRRQSTQDVAAWSICLVPAGYTRATRSPGATGPRANALVPGQTSTAVAPRASAQATPFGRTCNHHRYSIQWRSHRPGPLLCMRTLRALLPDGCPAFRERWRPLCAGL